MLNYNMAHPAKVSKLLTANFTVMSSALQQSLLQYEKVFQLRVPNSVRKSRHFTLALGQVQLFRFLDIDRSVQKFNAN